MSAGPIDDPNNALLASAANGDADGVAIALRSGAEIEARDSSGRTPLQLAVAAGHEEVATLLTALGADASDV